ncbi:MAG: hypothetical protein LQ343_000694 [Gyalolechia ehrenbergii]|nr:MAG: hypothetical protein LQ343_000694 [Gyalolechia ehrenbergii]
MTEAILHSESYAMHASERPDFRNTDGPDPSDKSKWLDVVKLLSFSSDSTVEEKEAVDKEMEKELRPLDLTPRPFPLETIDLYRKIIVMLPDVDPNTGKELKELKRSATFSDEILCALFVETFTCCKPRRCLQIEHPDHAGWSSDLLASDDGDYHSVSEA